MKLLTTLSYFISIAFAQTAVDPAGGRIYISKDQGVNWERADKGFPADAAVNAWVVQGEKVIAGTNAHGIFISSDRLKSWYPSGKGLSKNTRIISLASHKNILLAGTYTDGIFISDDGGESWHLSNTGLKNLTIRSFYSKGLLLLAGTNDGIYSSSDYGKSWILEKSGFQLNAFSFSNNQIFAATNQGVVVSKDYGKTWHWIYKDSAIYTLAANEKEIYIMDFFGNVYRSPGPNFIWLKSDVYLPLHDTFQLTPASPKFLTAAWKRAFKNMTGVNQYLRNNGLPVDSAFAELLDTPFGLLACAVSPKKIGC